MGSDVAAIHLGRALLHASRNLPGRLGRKQPRELPLAPPLFGLAPGGVCRAASVAGRAVGSYPTLSPLPRKRGGLLSVALSLGLPPPAVSRHRVSMEPDRKSTRLNSSHVKISYAVFCFFRALPTLLSFPTRRSSDLRAAPIRSCSRWGLPCRFRCRSRGGLLPHPFTLTTQAWRSAFCGTFPGVAPAGR